MRGEKLSSKARRPYLMGKESVGNFYKADVRFLKEVVGRESEFEKPYLDEDYRKMHFDFPVPDWPPFPDLPPWPELPPGPVPGLSLCAITCYAPGGGDCSEPIWCHPSIWCGTDMSCNLCSWIVSGATIGYTWKHIVDGVPSKTRGIEIWIDENLLTEEKALIHAQMKDPCGNLCGENLEVTCKVCPPEVIVSWDSDLSPETIGRSTSVSVYVKDGIGPYSWEVAGTGFTMGSSQTEGVQGSLVSDATACGTATITVTDFCGDVTTGEVRCTFGQWIIQDYANAMPTNPDPTKCSTGRSGSGCLVGPWETIVGEERWMIHNEYCWGYKDAGCPGWGSVVWQELHANLDNWKDPPCGQPSQCAHGSCSGTCDGDPCGGCYMGGAAYYYLWGC